MEHGEVIRYYYITTKTMVPPPAPPRRNAIGYFLSSSPPSLRTLNIVWSKRRVTWKETTGTPSPSHRQISIILCLFVLHPASTWRVTVARMSGVCTASRMTTVHQVTVLFLVNDMVFIATCHGQSSVACYWLFNCLQHFSWPGQHCNWSTVIPFSIWRLTNLVKIRRCNISYH